MFSTESSKFIIFILLISAVFCFLILLILTVIKNYQQKQILFSKRIDQIKILHENNLLKSQIQTQENTFQNISREIHDNIGQKLTLAKLQLNALLHIENEMTAVISNSVSMISESLEDLRDISRSLSSEVIMNYGIIRAIENEINLIVKTCKFRFKLMIIGDTVFMPAEKELIVFRIIQEGLTNIIKHSEADNVEISLHYTKEALTVCLRDDGKGFDPTETAGQNGLINMKNRAILLQGVFHIESAQGSGTTINITIPYQNQSNE